MRSKIAKWPAAVEDVFEKIEGIVDRVRLLTGGGFVCHSVGFNVRDRGTVHLDVSQIKTAPGEQQYVRGTFKDHSEFSVRGVVDDKGIFIIEELIICDVPIGEEGISPISGPEEYVFSETEIDCLNQELQT